MGHRPRLPALVLASFTALLLPCGWARLLAEEPASPAPKAAESAKDSVAGAIVGRLDGLSLSSLWDSVARLEGLGKTAVPAIKDAASHHGEKAQLGAAKALLSLGDEGVRQEALKGIARLAQKGSDKEVRAAAIELLGSEDPEGSPELLRQIFDQAGNDPEVVIPAARVLWELEQEPRARARLLELVGSRDRRVRFPAALALAQIQCFDGEVKSALRELRKEPSSRGRLASSLLQADNTARREERDLDAGATVLPGVDPAKLLKQKETRIRELEAQVEGLGRSRGAAGGGDPVVEEVLQKIQENYVDEEKTKRKELVLSAVKGMVRSLDDFSSFFDVDETSRFLTDIKGEYFGIGAQVSKLTDDGPLEVLKPIYGGGAYQVGIRTGDKILEVDGVATDERPLEEVIEKLLKGPEGTTVTLKVFRRGWEKPQEFKVPRRVIEVPSVLSEMLPASIGYLRLINFGEKSVEEFEKALDELESKGMEGLIFDLRYNPGGLLPAAVKIVDMFVGERDQPIVTRRGRRGTDDIRTEATAGERPNYPMVILVNGRSASASEIVSGALKDFHRATLVGQKTFGKGSVQTLFPMSPQVKDILGGETRLRLTVQYYYLPSGRCIHTIRDERGRVVPGREGGVEPDINVEMEQYPGWLSEEVEKIRSSQKILDYLDKHYAELKGLGAAGDGRDQARWADFDALYRSLDTRASPDHVRQVLRYHLRRRLEDERGKEFPCDLQEDNQLQRGVIEMLAKLSKDPAATPAYGWLKGKEFPAGRLSADHAGSPGSAPAKRPPRTDEPGK
jgi:carboxyl-terminal processing protease